MAVRNIATSGSLDGAQHLVLKPDGFLPPFTLA